MSKLIITLRDTNPQWIQNQKDHVLYMEGAVPPDMFVKLIFPETYIQDVERRANGDLAVFHKAKLVRVINAQAWQTWEIDNEKKG